MVNLLINHPYHLPVLITHATFQSCREDFPATIIEIAVYGFLARTQTSAVLEHANETGHLPIWKEVKFIGRDPHWYTCRVKEAIHIRLHPNNINRDSGIEILEALMPTIKKHNSQSITKLTCEGTTSSRNNNEDRNAPIAAN